MYLNITNYYEFCTLIFFLKLKHNILRKKIKISVTQFVR